MDQARGRAPVSGEPLAADELERIREQVAEAVFAGPSGLRDALETDRGSYLRLVAAAAAAASEGDRLLHDSVGGARRAGHSWDAIGGVLGVSRQAAQQRFRAAAGEPAEEPNRRVLTGVHAFNEAQLLHAAGRAGEHLVALGPGYLIVEESDRTWEHRRVIAPTRAAQRRLEGDGWQYVAASFPFRYYKRP
jgi:hypothetical protein